MPWSPSAAARHTKKATTEKLKRLWSDVANDVLKRTGSESQAVKSANAAVNRAAQHGAKKVK